MADRVDVKLKAKDPNNENTTTTISYINPEATNSAMKQFAQKLNALTRNTYSESDKIETTNLDLAPDSHRTEPSLNITPTSTSAAAISAGASGYAPAIIECNSDARPYAITPGETYACSCLPSDTSGKYTLVIYKPANGATVNPGTIIIRVDATENYEAAEVTFTVT